jgi:hypothetical protein
MATGRGEDESHGEPPLFDGGAESDTVLTSAEELRARTAHLPTERHATAAADADVITARVRRIDTDRDASGEHSSAGHVDAERTAPNPRHVDAERTGPNPRPIDAERTGPNPRHNAERRAVSEAIGRIDTDRHLPSPTVGPPLASDELRREMSDGGYARIDTLPDGFAAILQRRALRPGDVVGSRYKLIEVLGGGAMGDVFVALNLAIGARVAVKVLKPELLANPEFRQRFQYEAQAVGSIEHPNVARFLDIVVGDPTFLVMEFVPGETLSALLSREHKLPPPRAVQLAIRLCWGLDAAHAAGVIHRDLKPSNVILTADREHGEQPKLIDFGLAKIATVAATEQVTRTGQIIGTPAYMSPEQIAGREVDARSDVYALACLLYELISGKTPFAGADDVQTLYRQLHEPPEPLSLNAPGVGGALDRVLHRALAKNPADRFGSMQELARALNAAVEKRRLGATGGQPALRGPEPSRWSAVWLAGGFLVGALAASGAWTLRDHRGGAADTASGGTLLVTSTPPGARVTIDGHTLATSTPTAAHGLGPGAHAVRVEAPGRAPVEQHPTLAVNGRQLVEVHLPPQSRQVRVDTVPAGAMVYVDGVLQVGQTPMQLTVTDDEFHDVRLARDGFELGTLALKPDDSAPEMTVNLVPERQQRGTLMLDSEVIAEVWIDGEDSGFVSPGVFRLAAGLHTIQLRDGDQARSPIVKARLRSGAVTRLTLRGAP